MKLKRPQNDEIFEEEDLGFNPFDDSITTVCFTGHRQIPDSHKEAVKELLPQVLSGLYARGARIFKAGGAVGFDTMAAQAVIDLKAQTRDRDIKLVLCLAAPDQAKRFSAFDKIIYKLVLENSDFVTYSSDKSTSESYFARNRKLVEGSDVCVAYCTEQKGGTYYTCKQALLGGVEFINIADFIEG